MTNDILPIAIIGMGGRGGYAYGLYLHEHPEKFRIDAICDIDPSRLEKWGKILKLSPKQCFANEDEFWKQKRADVVIIATGDRLHIPMAHKALNVGYDILLEKPISENPDELNALLAHAKEAKHRIMVCHVLRYTIWIKKCKEIIDSGAIGRLVSIDHTENVVYWHEAHSYVRGNWRRKETSGPMILTKCCHDLDLLQYFANSRCKSIASMGDLRYFKKENKPQASKNATRCVDCPLMETCTYSAKKIYVDNFELGGHPQVSPYTLITDAYPVTTASLWKSIRETNYGKCVFACDNDVVDNETTIMTFDNGITATLKMEAFVRDGGRDIRFFGTEGELDLYEGENLIVYKKFTGETKTWKINELTDDLVGHGGGDHRMLDALYEAFVNGDPSIYTSLESSLESHFMAIAAEDSRLHGGTLVPLTDYRPD